MLDGFTITAGNANGSSATDDDRGNLIREGVVWHRAAMRDGRVSLHEIELPAGRYLIEAWTDSGLKGSSVIEAGPQLAAQGEREIVMR